MKILSGVCDAKSGNEVIFKPTFGIESLHLDSNDTGFNSKIFLICITKQSPAGKAHRI